MKHSRLWPLQMDYALRRRGVIDPAASLAAEVGVISFQTAFARWVSEPDGQDLSRLIRGSFDQLKDIIVGPLSGLISILSRCMLSLLLQVGALRSGD